MMDIRVLLAPLSNFMSWQEADLVFWELFGHPALQGTKVDVPRNYVGSQGEVQQDDGEEEE